MMSKLKGLSVVYKLLIFVLFIISSITLVISYVSLKTFNEAISESVQDNLKNTAKLKIKNVEEYYSSSLKGINSFVSIPEIESAVKKLIFNQKDSVFSNDNRQMEEMSKALLNSYGYKSFYILSQNAELLFGDDNVSKQDAAFHLNGKVLQDIIISDIFKEGGQFYSFLSKPVTEADSVIGYVSVKMDMSSIYAIIQDTTGLGRTGESLIAKRTDDNGALFLNPLRHKQGAALSLKAEKGNVSAKPMLDAIARKEGFNIGQCVIEKENIYLTEVPDNFV